MVTKYRADQVGSFLRPKEILDARTRGASPEELKAVEDKAILEVLQKQKDLGFKIFSDGELRRTTFMSDFNDAVEGVGSGDAVSRTWSGQTAGNLGVAVGKIQARSVLTAHEMAFMREHSPGDIKMTLPSANQFPAILYKKGITDAVYPNHSALLWDCVPVVRGGSEGAGRRRRQVHPARRAALQLLHRPEVARLHQERDGHGPRRCAGRSDSSRQHRARRDRRAGTTSCRVSTSAAATTAASGTPRAATTLSPRSCSTS